MGQLMTQEREVARPLKVLVPLIREKLKAGDEAGMSYYAEAGEMLLEAKPQIPRGEFEDWIKSTFDISYSHANVYMNLAKKQKSSQEEFASLNDFRRKHMSRPVDGNPPWHQPVKQVLDNPALIERIKQDTQRRVDEAKIARELGLKLIDIGYKVLCTKLHPDKGGSKEAMERLNYVRDRLKKALPLA